ncbi:MAG: DUF3343 domain-containing protein [Anaerolineae bacterium]|nr:DUF3343 domain-containing protein [Anaerolineae bacterium]
MTYGVALFRSTSLAIRAERACLQAGLRVKLIPTPRELSANCGTALRFPWEERAAVEDALSQARVEVEGLHMLAPRQRAEASDS